MIDNRGDFRTFMQNYAYAHGNQTPRGPRRDGPSEEGFVSLQLALPHLTDHCQLPPLPLPQHVSPMVKPPSIPNLNGKHVPPAIEQGRPTFGIDLGEQMARDDVEVPPIMKKCCEAIEKYGIQSQGVYRISGTMSKVQSLKAKLDKGRTCCAQSSPTVS